MRVFLAGIMQGSHREPVLHDQDYRTRLKELLAMHLPIAHVYDPLADHADSLDYDDHEGREVFMRHNRLSAEVDVLLAFVPEASMGTAIEMWQAHQNGRVVVTISPLEVNWAVRFLSHIRYSDVAHFERALSAGELLIKIEAARAAIASAASVCPADEAAT